MDHSRDARQRLNEVVRELERLTLAGDAPVEDADVRKLLDEKNQLELIIVRDEQLPT